MISAILPAEVSRRRSRDHRTTRLALGWSAAPRMAAPRRAWSPHGECGGEFLVGSVASVALSNSSTASGTTAIEGFESGTGDGDGGVDRTLTPAIGGEADQGSVCADGSISERREPWAAGVAELAKGVVQDGPRSGAGGKASGPLHGSESPGHRCVGPLSTTTSPRASFAFAPVTFRSTVVAGPLTQVEALKLVPGAGAMNAESLPGSVVTAVPRWRRSDTPSGTTGPARRRRSACAYSGRSNWMGPDSSIRIVAVAPEASCTVSGRLAATSNAATPTPTLTVSGSGMVQ